MPPSAVRHLLRNTPTIAPVPHRSLLYLSGSQSTEFINGLLASTVPKFGSGPFLSVFIHAQGRVLHDVFVYPKNNARGHDGYIIEYDNRPSEAPPLLQSVKRYILRSKVKIEDVTEEYDVWSIWGSDRTRSWETSRRWSFARSGAIEPVWAADEPWPWGNEDCRLRDRRAVGMGERVLVRKGDRRKSVFVLDVDRISSFEAKESSDHDAVDSDEYTLHRILHGVPEGATDIPPMHAFPMESNLDIMGGLDFRKGCYVGQELTVRTYHTGMVRKRILPIQLHATDGSALDTNTQLQGDIRAVVVDQQSVPRPRPRGSGKLLSTMRGVGLALLRLEHVEGCESGRLQFLVDSGEGESEKTSWRVSHWWPEWWPKEVAE